MLYVLASELLLVESTPLAVYLQKISLYSIMPWKRRLDKATKYLKRAIASKMKAGSKKNIRLLDKAAAERFKPMLPEILHKRAVENLSASR